MSERESERERERGRGVTEKMCVVSEREGNISCSWGQMEERERNNLL